VALGAVLTAALFTFGKWAIGLYLGMSTIGSAYGAAGTLVVFPVWTYYSCAILFLGAVLTHQVAVARHDGVLVAEGHAAPNDIQSQVRKEERVGATVVEAPPKDLVPARIADPPPEEQVQASCRQGRPVVRYARSCS